MPAKHPYRGKPRNPLWNYVTPINTGLLASVTLASLPGGVSIGGKYTQYITDALIKSDAIPKRFYLAGLGFVVTYITAKTLGWLRWKLVKSLLTYTGWMTSPKSLRTKAWALLLKSLYGPGPLSTFALQPYLPNMPLPSLDATLDRWLIVAKELVNEDEYEVTKERVEQFRKNEGPKLQKHLREKWLIVAKELVNEDEYEVTKERVEQFRKNEGPKLQKHLREKAKTTDSWINDYWLNAVYLASRQPLAINSNYYGLHILPEYKTTDPLARAATVARIFAECHEIIEKEQLPPVFLQDIVPLCMDGYKYMYNTVRIPKPYQDIIERHPGNSHIVVIRKGHYFKIDLHYKDGTLLTAEEIKILLHEIRTTADSLPRQLPVASLTGQGRDIWAQQRVKLVERNEDIVKDIDTSMFVFSLSDQKPESADETARMSLTGNDGHIWFDKCMTYIVYDNGVSGAGNIDHTVLDAMVFVTLTEYLMLFEDYENGDVKNDPNVSPRPLQSPQRLTWDVTDMEEDITKASKDLTTRADDIEVKIHLARYGKRFMKKCRLSPDGFIQMSLQLAYYKMYKEIVRTYEPSTLRLFLMGRTETINPISSMSVAWVKAMGDGVTSDETKQELLKKAINYQAKYRLDGTIGKGCDRHLLALMCASRELGMDLPNIFMDKPWQLPYKLSTSQTPIRVYDYGADYNYDVTCGGFCPGCPDGYGISYVIYGDDILQFHITSYKSCSTTSSSRFAESLDEAFEDMKTLFSKP